MTRRSPIPPVRLNLRDAARMFGVSDWTLRQAITRGELQAVVLGDPGKRRTYSVRVADVEAWFAGQRDAFTELAQ